MDTSNLPIEREGYVVLVGSFARGDHDETSDCDVLLVDADESEFEVPEFARCNAGLGFIKFDGGTFNALRVSGSLFLRHAFFEGVLLKGSKARWDSMAERFRVKPSFSEEIAETALSTELLSKTEIFGGTFLTPLSTAFVELKNASIFSLAHRGVFQFNKAKCIDLALSNAQLSGQLIQLKKFFDYSVRSLDVDLPFDPRDSNLSAKLLRLVNEVVQEMAHDCRR